ncbi:MAG: TIGR04283 family arsenosugar biosynthesis glycosyltransferase [Chromatiaceae bacterium]|jgi:rSAM/selenodomain-associated transferase 2|nr:TIGR04283 family arsenosugar biosynthesis glycosyltransferase [Chromatiaceae bacterium]
MTTARESLRLSVIVPTLNEQEHIGALLHDLASLRSAGHEVILVDGSSSDATRAVAAAWVDRIVEAKRGRASQMNAGAHAASGGVLWFLHADTRLVQGAGDAVLQAVADGRAWGRFDVRLSGQQRLLRVVETLMNLRSRISGVATGDQGIFVTRAAFSAVGGFPAIPLMEDIALCKLLRRQARPACIRRPRLQTSSRRWEEHGILRTIVLMWRLRLAYALGTEPAELVRRYP